MPRAKPFIGGTTIRGAWFMAALSITVPAVAHHSFAMFDQSREQHIDGTLAQFEWVNPHSWLWIKVPDGKGGQTLYALETAGTGMLNRMGVQRTTFRPGDKVSMDLHPFKDGRPGGEWVRAHLADGRVLDLARARQQFSNGGEAVSPDP